MKWHRKGERDFTINPIYIVWSSPETNILNSRRGNLKAVYQADHLVFVGQAFFTSPKNCAPTLTCQFGSLVFCLCDYTHFIYSTSQKIKVCTETNSTSPKEESRKGWLRTTWAKRDLPIKIIWKCIQWRNIIMQSDSRTDVSIFFHRMYDFSSSLSTQELCITTIIQKHKICIFFLRWKHNIFPHYLFKLLWAKLSLAVARRFGDIAVPKSLQRGLFFLWQLRQYFLLALSYWSFHQMVC